MPPQTTLGHQNNDNTVMQASLENQSVKDSKYTRLFAQKELGMKIQRALDELGGGIELEINNHSSKRMMIGIYDETPNNPMWYQVKDGEDHPIEADNQFPKHQKSQQSSYYWPSSSQRNDAIISNSQSSAFNNNGHQSESQFRYSDPSSTTKTEKKRIPSLKSIWNPPRLSSMYHEPSITNSVTCHFFQLPPIRSSHATTLYNNNTTQQESKTKSNNSESITKRDNSEYLDTDYYSTLSTNTIENLHPMSLKAFLS